MALIRLLLIGLALTGLALAQSQAAWVMKVDGPVRVHYNESEGYARTLQMLPDDSEVELPDQSILRLTYLSTRHREQLTGPCRVRITSVGGHWLEGEPIKVERGSGVINPIPAKENLRRAGGDLHASAFLPTFNLRYTGGITTTSTTQAIRANSLPRLKATTSRAYADSQAVCFRVQNGQGPYQVTIWDGRIRYRGNSLQPQMDLPPGTYQFKVQDHRKSTVEGTFLVLSEREAARIQRARSQAVTQEQRVEVLATLMNFSLLEEALAYNRELVTAYPNDAGLWANLGNLLARVGLKRESDRAYQRARQALP